MKGFFNFFFNKPNKKKSASTREVNNNNEANDSESSLSISNPDPDKIKNLPPVALKVFKSSGLSTQQALDNWGIFLNCLYYSTPKKTFPKPPPIIDEKRGSQETSLVYPDALSSSVVKEFDEDFESISSNISDSELPHLLINLGDNKDLEDGSLESKSNEEAFSSDERFEGDGNESNLDSSSELEELTLKMSDLITMPKSNKKRKKKKKQFTEAELVKIVIKENPKEIYKDFREIGRGAYGKVYIATDKQSKKKLAVKHMKKEWDEDSDSIVNEITLLDSCHHINVVNYMKSYLFQNRVWMVMEYCDAGTLKQLLVIELNESQMANILQQVLLGIEYLHIHHRIHRDIKSANILMNMNGEVKVADLGLCVEGSEEGTTGMAGSKYWMAPEMIKRQPYNSKVDIWSIGSLCMEMMEGSPPYGNFKPLKALFLTATQGAPNPKKMDKWTETLKDFLRNCFIKDPSKRPSASELLQHALIHKSCERKELVKALKLVFLMRVTAGL